MFCEKYDKKTGSESNLKISNSIKKTEYKADMEAVNTKKAFDGFYKDNDMLLSSGIETDIQSRAMEKHKEKVKRTRQEKFFIAFALSVIFMVIVFFVSFIVTMQLVENESRQEKNNRIRENNKAVEYVE